MPVKRGPAELRRLELTFDVPGTPEQVWQAIATGPGISAWFVPSEIEEREGGAVKFLLGPGMESLGTVTKWQPPSHLAYEEPDWSAGAPPLATEFIVETREGGACRVRLVHSLFTSAENWDDELDGMEKGWGPFFEVLRIYLRDFAGQKAASIRPTGRSPEEHESAFRALLAALGAELRGGRFETTAADAPRLLGRVEELGETGHAALLVRLEQPSPGAALLGTYAWGGQTHVAVSVFVYGEDADRIAMQEGAVWDAWMTRHFPP